MAGHTELTKDVDIDIGALFSNIWKKKWLILILSALAGAGIFLVMNSISPRYKTTVQLIIEPRESQFTRVEQQNGGINANEYDAAAVLSQVQIILSDNIALSTIKRLELATKPEFRDEDNPSVLSDFFVLIGLKNDPLDVSPDERVLKAFKERLKAYSIQQSRVIEILFWANDRKLAKEITNTIADEYLKMQRKSKLETDSDATKFLEPEIAALRAKVRAAEAKVAEFRSNSDILVGNNNALLATQQLSEVSTELLRVRTQRSAAQAKVESVRSTLNIGASLEAIPEVVASPLIQRLRERQVQLRAQISELSTTLLPAHPRLKALKSQVSDFERQVLGEARGILASLESNVVIARKQENSLVQELSRLKSEAARAGEAEVELRALEREAVSERELLQAYMTKFREAAGRQSSKYLPINVRIISEAHLPTESFFPKTIPYTIAGMIVTAILSAVGILTASLLSGKAFRTITEDEEYRVHQPSEMTDPTPNESSILVENAVGEEPVAYDQSVSSFDLEDPNIPKDDQNPDKLVSPPLMNMDQENLIPPYGMGINENTVSQNDNIQNDNINDNINVSLAAEGLLGIGKSRVAIVSPGGDDGSITTWLLARKLAEAGKTVAVMDMTGSGITTRQMLGDTSLKGVGDVLAGITDFDEVIHRDLFSTATVLPVGVSVPQDANAALERLSILVDSLSKGYDYLIIDCGFADVDGLARVADHDTVILISAIGSSDALVLEDDLIANGYTETVTVHPSDDEMQSIANMAA